MDRAPPPIALIALFLGVFVLVMAIFAPVFRSRRKERDGHHRPLRPGVAAGTTEAAKRPQRDQCAARQMGDQVMEGRESTTKTMALLDRADLPWRAGEWFVLRIAAVIVASRWATSSSRPGHGSWGSPSGSPSGCCCPPSRYGTWLGGGHAFEFVLPDVLMLVATSLASGFSLLQALDAVARDAPEPAGKEFSRALAETRIEADVSDALDHMAERMDSENMRWATMAIRIQREVGGNLAETLRDRRHPA